MGHALKYILPAALGAGALVAGPELLGALGPAEAAGGAATLGGSDALASAALAAPEGGLLSAAPDVLTSTALPAASPFLATPIGPATPIGAAQTASAGFTDAIPGAGATSPVTSPGAGVTSPLGPPSVQPGIQTVTTPPPAPPAPTVGTSAAPGAAGTAPAAPAGVAGPSASDIVSGGSAGGAGTGLIPGTDTPLPGSAAPNATSLNDILSGAGDFAKGALPFLGPAASLGGLALSFMRNNQPLPYQPNISGAASTINNTAGNIANISPNILSAAQGQVGQGQSLENFLASGTLPPGVQNGINTATEQAKAAIKSKYASSGASGSSAEAEDLANVDSLAAGQGAQLALQLYNTGVSEVSQGVAGEGAAANVLGSSASTTGMVAQLYQYLMEQSLARDQALGGALGNFASSLVPRTNINLTSGAA